MPELGNCVEDPGGEDDDLEIDRGGCHGVEQGCGAEIVRGIAGKFKDQESPMID